MDARRFMENSTHLEFRVEWQARSPDGPIGLVSVTDPTNKRTVKGSDLQSLFTQIPAKDSTKNVCASASGKCRS